MPLCEAAACYYFLLNCSRGLAAHKPWPRAQTPLGVLEALDYFRRIYKLLPMILVFVNVELYHFRLLPFSGAMLFSLLLHSVVDAYVYDVDVARFGWFWLFCVLKDRIGLDNLVAEVILELLHGRTLPQVTSVEGLLVLLGRSLFGFGGWFRLRNRAQNRIIQISCLSVESLFR